MTPKQRYDLYGDIQNSLILEFEFDGPREKRRSTGMCYCIIMLFSPSHISFDLFIELIELRPNNYRGDGLWFPLTERGLQQRLELLEKAKEMTKTAKN